MREERGLTLKDMARALHVSSAYLSALEHGKRGMPTWSLMQRIIAYFNVIWDDAEELQRLAELSDPRVTIDTSGLSPEATEFANRLARSIGGLSREDLDFLKLELIKRAGRKG
jgi:transcriptional regulator with XRE-family HTH domain